MNGNKINYAGLTEKALQKAELDFSKAVWNGKTKFNISIPAKNLPGLYTSLLVDDTGDVLYRCYIAYDIDKDKWLDIIMECNRLNSNFRFLCMSLDDEGDLCAAYDFSVFEKDEELITENIMETFFLCFQITEKCAPYLLKLVWKKDITESDEFKMKISHPQEETN